MNSGQNRRLRWALTAGVFFAGAVLVIVSVVSSRPSGPTVAEVACSNQTSCSSASNPPRGGSGPPNPRSSPTVKGNPTSTPKGTPSHSGTPSASPAPKSSPTSAPTSAPPPPASSSSAPLAAGYFSLRPVGSWSSLPSDSTCAAQVHYSTWEPRPQNYQQNHTMPAAGAMAASFAARPRAVGGTYNALWDTWLLKRVDGRFTGTTDEIFQWAACKWGLPDNLARAEAVRESTWFQYLHFPSNASYGGGGGSCYWDYGCGDAFSSPTSASTTYCNAIASTALLSSEVHNYQVDPLTTAGRPPYTPTTGMCPKTFSILGVMSWEDPAWEAPYPPYAGNQNGTFPFTRDSTAAAADYWGAFIRGCFEGWAYWLNGGAGDLWGCVGSWYSGDWHSSAANGYISRVQNEENNHTWLTASFDDPRQQFSCDSKYGCPS
jgi:hypothetical protein